MKAGDVVQIKSVDVTGNPELIGCIVKVVKVMDSGNIAIDGGPLRSLADLYSPDNLEPLNPHISPEGAETLLRDQIPTMAEIRMKLDMIGFGTLVEIGGYRAVVINPQSRDNGLKEVLYETIEPRRIDFVHVNKMKILRP